MENLPTNFVESNGFERGKPLTLICSGTGGKSGTQMQIIQDAIDCIENPTFVSEFQKRLVVDYLKQLSKILAIYA